MSIPPSSLSVVSSAVSSWVDPAGYELESSPTPKPVDIFFDNPCEFITLFTQQSVESIQEEVEDGRDIKDFLRPRGDPKARCDKSKAQLKRLKSEMKEASAIVLAEKEEVVEALEKFEKKRPKALLSNPNSKVTLKRKYDEAVEDFIATLAKLEREKIMSRNNASSLRRLCTSGNWTVQRSLPRWQKPTKQWEAELGDILRHTDETDFD